jgi:hypothetical protein
VRWRCEGVEWLSIGVPGRSSGDAEARWIRAVGAMWRRDGSKSWR